MVRHFSCHNCPSHALRKINARGRLGGTGVRPLNIGPTIKLYAVPVSIYFNRKRHEEKKKLQEGMSGSQSDPPPSIFKSIQPVNMKLGMCNKCPKYFLLSIVTWHQIAFYGKHSNKLTSLVTAFWIFNFFFTLKLKH